MGEIYTATCKCGYSKDDIFLGIGMSDYLPSMAFCKSCNLITNADFFHEIDPKCKVCSSILFQYSDEQLSKTVIVNDKEVVKNYCPNCYKFTLELAESGLWD